MKTIILIVFATLCSGIVYGQDSAQANSLHGTLEQENTVSGGKVTPQLKVYATYGGKTKTGAYCWIQISKPYSQFYCGPTFQLKNWIQVGVALGLETGKKPVKGAGFVWAGKGRFSNLLVLEKGSTFWYRNQGSFKANKVLTVSVASQRYEGTGPRIDLAIPKTRLTVGGEYLFSTQTAKFGLKYDF